MIYRLIILATLLNTTGLTATLTVPGQYSSIQSAINASTDQDTVMVSPGFYQENISFNGKNIVVTSTYVLDQDSLIIGSTIIDGNNNGSVAIFDEKTQMFKATSSKLPCSVEIWIRDLSKNLRLEISYHTVCRTCP